MSSDAAWLIFGKYRPDRYQRNSWVAMQPLGVKVLQEIMTQAGLAIDTCSPQAPHSNVVLVSLTSEQDVAQFYQQVSLLEHWQPRVRTFRVVAGGYGMQNPYPLRDYVDYMFFGRAESEIVQLLADATARRPSHHPAVMNAFEQIHPVEVVQAQTLYDGQIFQEAFTGCPLKCKFCHYTFARKHQGTDHAYSMNTATRGALYVQTTGHGTGGAQGEQKGNLEITWPQLLDWPHPQYYPHVTVGLDGPSVRLRTLYGKPISDSEIVEGLDTYFRDSHQAGLSGSFFKIYDIGGFPGETQTDRQQLERALCQVAPPPRTDYKATVIVHVTPFKASAWTPMQWEAFSLTNFAKLYGRQTIAVWDGDPSRLHHAKGARTQNKAYYSTWIEGPGMQLLYSGAARHDGSAAHHKAWHTLLHSRQLKTARSAVQVQMVRRAFPDVFRAWTGEHEVGAPLPTQIAKATVDVSVLARIARKMRRERHRSETEPVASFLGRRKTLSGNLLAAGCGAVAPVPPGEIALVGSA